MDKERAWSCWSGWLSPRATGGMHAELSQQQGQAGHLLKTPTSHRRAQAALLRAREAEEKRWGARASQRTCGWWIRSGRGDAHASLPPATSLSLTAAATWRGWTRAPSGACSPPAGSESRRACAAQHRLQ